MHDFELGSFSISNYSKSAVECEYKTKTSNKRTKLVFLISKIGYLENLDFSFKISESCQIHRGNSKQEAQSHYDIFRRWGT